MGFQTAVVVAVRIDEARREHETMRIDDLLALLRRKLADRRDSIAGDAYVDASRWCAGAIDDTGIAHDEVGGRNLLCGREHGQHQQNQVSGHAGSNAPQGKFVQVAHVVQPHSSTTGGATMPCS